MNLKERLDRFVAEGWINATPHPYQYLDYTIYCYSKKGNYERPDWPWEMRVSRGLVLDSAGNIVMRGMPKFFNIEQLDASKYPWDDAIVTEKLDGTMILVSHDPTTDETLFTTKGSFSNEYTQAARQYAPSALWDLAWEHPNLTYVFELIHPVSKNIVEYKTSDYGLWYLGAMVNDEHGRFIPNTYGWDITKTVPKRSLSDLPKEWTSKAREQEGYVVYFPSINESIKVKNPAYFEAAALRDHLSKRKIYELWTEGKLTGEYVNPLPKEDREYVLAFLDVCRQEWSYAYTKMWHIAANRRKSGHTFAEAAYYIKTRSTAEGIPDAAVFMYIKGKDYKKPLIKHVWEKVKDWEPEKA